MQTEELFKKWGIAVTGNIATGKSFVCQLLKKMNYPVIDADILSRQILDKGTEAYHKVITHFGENILDSNGDLDRKKLSKEIFADEDKRNFLESVVHPELEQLVTNQLKNFELFEKPKLWFYEAALVIEKKKQKMFREVWLTHCTNATQIGRLKERKNNYNDQEIKNILASQLSFVQKRKHCHFEINTDFAKEILLDNIKERLKNT
jgi:dephospho-CoA kinase